MLGKTASAPRMKKTGTTIVGVTFKVRFARARSSVPAHSPSVCVQGGVVLGADTRATNGDVVSLYFEYLYQSAWIACSFGRARADCGQELSKDSLHGSKHLVLWCWNCRRHGAHHW